MPAQQPAAACRAYLAQIAAALQRGDATEHTHRPALKALIEALLPGVTATNEPKRSDCGAPDFVVTTGAAAGPLIIGHVECKDVGVSLSETAETEQIKARYLPALPNFLLTDYLEFRWYVAGQLRHTARLASPGPAGRLTAEKGGPADLAALLADFRAQPPQRVESPRDLAQRMARLTHLIRDVIVQAFDHEQASVDLRDLREALQANLIPDLQVAQFADMFAQTLAYGLFAARVRHQGPPGSFRRLGAAAEIPKTNPFLRRLFETATGAALDEEPFAGIVDDLTQLLSHADTDAILRDFGKRQRDEDPIVHFYETFLAAYDPAEREKRGVYYTPLPVVSYIVRSVDELLRERFGCPAGLADDSQVAYPPGAGQATGPRVLVLDPACGTGTFLYAVVDLIRRRFQAQRNAGRWPGYVRDSLLHRLFAFELMMAPYAVAHLKLGMQLAGLDLPAEQRADWAYDFAGDERLQVYLTNSLEAPGETHGLWGAYRVIGDEAEAAAKVKRDLPIMVVLGNPPYSGHSANRSWMMAGKKRVPNFIGTLLQDYYQVDGQPLGERNPKWLQDDYVKFIRFGQWRIEKTGAGILALITNHSYLDNPTFRGMRQQLLNAFSDIYILNLHGNSKKKERAPDGGLDQNVFDIQQGVAIAILVREPGKPLPGQVHYADLWGTRQVKDALLAASTLTTTSWQTSRPDAPPYLLVPQTHSPTLRREYERGWSVADLMPLSSVGVVTSRDRLVTDPDKARLRRRMDLLLKGQADAELRRSYMGKKDTLDLGEARKAIKPATNLDQTITRVLYRPFDARFLFWHPAVVERPRPETMRHMLAGPNLALSTTRSVEISRGFEHVFCSDAMIQHHTVSLKEVNYLYPLYLYPMEKEVREGLRARDDRRPNISEPFQSAVAAALNAQVELHARPPALPLGGSKVFPEDILAYLYAILYSPTYRTRYAEFLKLDFPRIPLTSDRDLFWALVAKGSELVDLHLMRSPLLDHPITNYPIPGPSVVAKGHPKYLAPGDRDPMTAQPLAQGRVYISPNNPKTGERGQYFEGVPQEVWEFHIGGYQVAEKWLKDRRGRSLTNDDLTHYERTLVALKETIRLMQEIDDVIPGWPLP